MSAPEPGPRSASRVPTIQREKTRYEPRRLTCGSARAVASPRRERGGVSGAHGAREGAQGCQRAGARVAARARGAARHLEPLVDDDAVGQREAARHPGLPLAAVAQELLVLELEEAPLPRARAARQPRDPLRLVSVEVAAHARVRLLRQPRELRLELGDALAQRALGGAAVAVDRRQHRADRGPHVLRRHGGRSALATAPRAVAQLVDDGQVPRARLGAAQAAPTRPARVLRLVDHRVPRGLVGRRVAARRLLVVRVEPQPLLHGQGGAAVAHPLAGEQEVEVRGCAVRLRSREPRAPAAQEEEAGRGDRGRRRDR